MTTQAKFKATTTAGTGALAAGQFRALVSVFDNTDSYGDVIRPGAFTESIAEWETKGQRIPVIWSHDWGDPFSLVGSVVKATETAAGLEVIGEISEEDLEFNPKAAQVYRLLKAGRVNQFSFAYDVLEAGWAEQDGREVYELRQLAILEVGPCLVGVNRETELLEIKGVDPAALAAFERELVNSTGSKDTHLHDVAHALALAAKRKAQGTTPPADDATTVEDTAQRPSDTDTPPAPAPAGDQTTSPAASGEAEGAQDPDQDPAPARTPEQDPPADGAQDPAISLTEIDLIQIQAEGETP